MSQYDFDKQAQQTRQNKGFEPQKPNENADAFKQRVAADDWAKKNR